MAPRCFVLGASLAVVASGTLRGTKKDDNTTDVDVSEAATNPSTKNLETEVFSLAEAGGASCTSGNVGKLRAVAPQCIDNCQSSCGAVDSALTAYLRGGQPAATRSVCSHQSSFECFVTSNHIGACSTLIQKAASFGFHLPQSSSDLHSACHNGLAAMDTIVETNVTEGSTEASTKDIEDEVFSLAEAGGASCTSGNVGKLRAVAPQCIDNCQSSCGAVDSALTAYLRGGQPAATRSVCSHEGAFECFVTSNHIGACSTLIQKAASFGFHLPTSSGELHHACGHYLSAMDTIVEGNETAGSISVAGAAAPGGTDENDDNSALNDVESMQLWGGGSCHGSDKVVDSSKSCAASENYHCGGCYIYRQCKGRQVCVLNGYMIAPGRPLRGMEDINGGDASHWDFLWTAAEHQCGGDSCVLISNPIHFRTQHQMHLHYRHYNGGGASLKHRLESTLCGTSGWQGFQECGYAKAKLFDHMPGVFAAVENAYGGGNLGNVGITVWFTHKCGGGRKVMILAQTGCSIEHSISSR